MDKEISNSNSGEKVSVVDFVLVILKWRKMIVSLTVVALIVSASLIVGKLLFFPSAKSSGVYYTAKIDWRYVSVPVGIEDLFDVTIPNSVQAQMNDLNVVQPFFKDILMKDDLRFSTAEFSQKGSIEAFLSEYLIGNVLKLNVDGSVNMFHTVLTWDDSAKAIEFLKKLMATVKLELDKEFDQKVARARVVLEQTLTTLRNTTANGTQERILAISQMTQKLAQLEQMAIDPDFPFVQTGDPIIILAPEMEEIGPKRVSMSLVAGVIVFGTLFISLILSFLLEYFQRLRKDESVMSRLRAVLEKHPRSR